VFGLGLGDIGHNHGGGEGADSPGRGAIGDTLPVDPYILGEARSRAPWEAVDALAHALTHLVRVDLEIVQSTVVATRRVTAELAKHAIAVAGHLVIRR